MGTWSKSSGVVLTDPMVAWLNSFADYVHARDPDMLVHATSGLRTPEAQARALWTKRDRYDKAKAAGTTPAKYDDLRKLYVRGNGPKIVAALLAVPNDVAAMAKVLASFAEQGIYLSRHMRGDALDLRNRAWNSSQRKLAVEAAEALGARALMESDHLHIEQIGGGGGIAAAADAARGSLQAGVGVVARRVRARGALWWLAVGTAILGTVGAFYWWWRRRRRRRR